MRDEHQAEIGARIAALRERQGWSQRALAKWVGLDQSAVSRIEAGRRRLSAEELHRIAGALHASSDDLLEGEADSSGGRPFVPGPRTATAGGSPPPPDAGVADRPRIDLPPMAFRKPRTGSLELRASRPELPQDVSFETLVSVPQAPLTLSALPSEVASVVADWLTLRTLATSDDPARRWNTGHSAEGTAERLAHPASGLRPGLATGEVLYDRVARFWRSELHVAPDDGPLPDLVPLLEDVYGAQVIVARVAQKDSEAGASVPAAAVERPVAAAFTSVGVPFIFVNAARPVVLQRFALAHAFAHLALGHGDVVDRRIEWSRNVPPEAAANDFAEEFLAPVHAVRRWYERRDVPRGVRQEDLLGLANAFGISAWSALYRSRAAGRLQGRRFSALRAELESHEWEVLPRQAYLGGVKDTLSYLTPAECLPPGQFGPPAVLRVPAAMRAWALEALQGGRLSVEDAAALLRLEPAAFAEQLARLGVE